MDYAEELQLYTKAKVSKIKEMMSTGSVVEPLEFHRERPKSSGYMYGGRLGIVYKGIRLWFEMCYHHNGNEPMTTEEVIENLEPVSIEFQGINYDLHWHLKMLAGKCFLHKNGWFRNSEDRDKLRVNYLIRSRNEYLMGATEEDEKELLGLGFIRIPELDFMGAEDSNTLCAK